ncbi:hypothetical protein GUITHDRAFT_107632 [Guillardia theta CCMP2712]|uniref:Uncharacterized protein n=1 Tax=Guillardia theta (strain CCMP2712) TaxID=905079 RepID=L1JE63_GUITC|nr:hypothetical protein GUITHDRAFT_107632 [Guillardia theta CCMP2712]EKX46429.1 hypothetical protein GUITHDRAFT_107632 [Guillardia theta CCMP2712]|eukprot:XP_005833409.1 hypothetical protein GUITHDRAFT_107632 [Guillardia theta CCMP2712]
MPRELTVEDLEERREHREPVLLSPRSTEACRRQGYLTQELVFKDFDFFEERDLPDDIIEVRWQHYETRRKEKLRVVKEERQNLISVGWKPEKKDRSFMNFSHDESSTVDMTRSTAANKEQRILESIRIKRQQELEQLVAQELKAAKLMEETKKEEELQRQKEAAKLQEAKERQKIWDEAQRKKELAKVEAEKMQEEEQKEAAAREYQKEMARKEAEARQEEERKRLARERELAAIALREEQKQQLEAIFAHQEEILNKKKAEMEKRDQERKAMQEAKRIERILRAEEERQRSAHRISLALAQKKEALRQKRNALLSRQEKLREKKEAFEQEQRQSILLRQQKAEAKKAEIARTIQRMEDIENEKKMKTIQKEKSHSILSLKENLERLRRIEAFKRDEAEDRIRADDLRTQQLKRFRLNMLEQRKAFQRQNDMQRIEILKSIENMRSNPGKALANATMNSTA